MDKEPDSADMEDMVPGAPDNDAPDPQSPWGSRGAPGDKAGEGVTFFPDE